MNENIVAGLDCVESSVFYLADGQSRPVTIIYPPESGREIERPAQTEVTLPIYDTRQILAQLSLDGQGYVVTTEPSKFRHFFDHDRVVQSYYPEVAALVKAYTRATKVVVFDHNVRSAPRAAAKTDNARNPVFFAHNDYTERSGPRRVSEIVGQAEASELLKRRFALINVWRSIAGPVQDTPLAVCNASRMASADFVATEIRHYQTADLKNASLKGEIYSIRNNPNHQWLYVSDMQPDEVMLLKCYDSQTDGRARFTAHTAFRHPKCPANAIPRESIEVRTLVFFSD